MLLLRARGLPARQIEILNLKLEAKYEEIYVPLRGVGVNGCIAAFSTDCRTQPGIGNLPNKGAMLRDRFQCLIRWIDAENQARWESQLQLRMCVFRNGWVSVLCGLWLVLLTAVCHGAVWAAFPSDKQPQSLPCLSAPDREALPAFSCPLPTVSQAMRYIRCYQHCRLHNTTANGLTHEFTVQCRDYFCYRKPCFAHITKKIKVWFEKRKTGISVFFFFGRWFQTIHFSSCFVKIYKNMSVHTETKLKPLS